MTITAVLLFARCLATVMMWLSGFGLVRPGAVVLWVEQNRKCERGSTNENTERRMSNMHGEVPWKIKFESADR